MLALLDRSPGGRSLNLLDPGFGNFNLIFNIGLNSHAELVTFTEEGISRLAADHTDKRIKLLSCCGLNHHDLLLGEAGLDGQLILSHSAEVTRVAGNHHGGRLACKAFCNIEMQPVCCRIYREVRIRGNGEVDILRLKSLECDDTVLSTLNRNVGLLHACQGNNLEIVKEPAVELAVGGDCTCIGGRSDTDTCCSSSTVDYDYLVLPGECISYCEDS